MIQRKQTLFLFQSIFLGIALLFVPSATFQTGAGSVSVHLAKISTEGFGSSSGHMAAILLNFSNLVLATIAIFLYRKRELQVKLSYLVFAIWLALTGMILFCPFVAGPEGNVATKINYFSPAICIVGASAALFALRFIKKDIELLKSADRIR